MPLRSCLAYAKHTACAIFAASMTSAWYYRPIADADAATHNSPPWARERVPLLLEWARCFSIGATTLAIRFFMHSCGTYEIEDDKAYRKFLQTVLGGNGRLQDQGLITVSNHRSLFDDPGVVSCLLPLPIAVQPKLQRWGLCSQEYCFNDALPGLVKGYIGAGQVLPICRGGGIDQRALLDFARHLACGEWCHVFPGETTQNHEQKPMKMQELYLCNNSRHAMLIRNNHTTPSCFLCRGRGVAMGGAGWAKGAARECRHGFVV